MLSTLVSFAVKEEAGPFREWAGARADVRVILTGMGKRNAEKAIRAALDAQPTELVLTCGLAGGLEPGLALGTVVFPVETESDLAAKLTAAGAQAVRFYCADRVATTAAEKRQLREKTGADAVEMESGIIQAVCREKGIRCATVRVILDTAETDLPLDFNQLLNENQELDSAKLAKVLLTSPGKIPALMRLQKQTRATAETLAQMLRKVLEGKA